MCVCASVFHVFQLNDSLICFVNPPNVEGAYYIDPFVVVYCEDYGKGGYAPGDKVSSETIRFTNQNHNYNTLDFEEKVMVEHILKVRVRSFPVRVITLLHSSTLKENGVMV